MTAYCLHIAFFKAVVSQSSLLLLLTEKINYKNLASMSAESIIKLELVRPETLGQATRIAGVRASDISILSIAIKQEG